MENTLVQMDSISKAFGSVQALDNAHLTLKKGEVHSLLGENGAGKSSLMNILSGIYMPDVGNIRIRGSLVDISSPKAAIDLGIGMIHQHFKLVDVLTAKENIVAGYDKEVFLKGPKLTEKIKEVSVKYGLEIDPDKKIYDMSVAEKQRVEILKVLYRGAEILILDEPTAVLTPQETEKLFQIIRNMTQLGCAVVIITHKLNEVMEISDVITVLRKGKYVATVKKDDTDTMELTKMMVGKAVDLSIHRPLVKERKKVMEIREISALKSDKTVALDRVTFDLYSGEILGVAGVAGSGQKELCEALAGLYPLYQGDVQYLGESILGKNPRDIIRMGITMSFVPEDRLGMGLVASMNIVDNILLKEYQKQRGMMITRKPSREKAQRIVDKLNISAPSTDAHPVRMLSGGNIQKVLLGREIESNPHVIITAYPTRGLDIGSSHLIYDLLNQQKQKDVAVLYVGEDLDVLMELCDRILVLYNGTVTGLVDAASADRDQIGLMMSGAHQEEVLS